jgi:hypothetical protein
MPLNRRSDCIGWKDRIRAVRQTKMPRSSRAELKYRAGCPLALVITALFVAALEALIYERAFTTSDWLYFGLVTGVPFGLLAIVRTRDPLAWLMALGSTASLWTGFSLADPRSTDFVWGFAMTLGPFIIGLICVAVAGARGRIAWALEGQNRPE